MILKKCVKKFTKIQKSREQLSLSTKVLKGLFRAKATYTFISRRNKTARNVEIQTK